MPLIRREERRVELGGTSDGSPHWNTSKRQASQGLGGSAEGAAPVHAERDAGSIHQLSEEPVDGGRDASQFRRGFARGSHLAPRRRSATGGEALRWRLSGSRQVHASPSEDLEGNSARGSTAPEVEHRRRPGARGHRPTRGLRQRTHRVRARRDVHPIRGPRPEADAGARGTAQARRRRELGQRPG